MTIEKQSTLIDDANKWAEAIIDAEQKAEFAKRQVVRLNRAIRLMKKQLADGAAWPLQPSTELLGQGSD